MPNTPSKPSQPCLPFDDGAKSGLSETALTEIYTEVLREFYHQSALPKIEVRYYHYVGINTTIRCRRKKFFVRVSDILNDAPPDVHRALALVLLSKILRRRVPQRADHVFVEYCQRPGVVQAHENSRQTRGRKMLSAAVGKAYDLIEEFRVINERYFGGTLPRPRLSWSRTFTRRIFGHHDPVHNAIVVSKSLDSPRVPLFVVHYILYHEMLHLKLRSTRKNGKVVHHSPEFRREERRFEKYDEASLWLEAFVASIRQRPKRKPRRASKRATRSQ